VDTGDPHLPCDDGHAVQAAVSAGPNPAGRRVLRWM